MKCSCGYSDKAMPSVFCPRCGKNQEAKFRFSPKGHFDLRAVAGNVARRR